MPFTLSHPAAVIPLRRSLGRWGVLGALVIGSMAPDFPYFLGIRWPREVTHSFASLLWFSLPAGWVAYLAFQHWLKPAAVFALPRGLRRRLRPEAHWHGFAPVTVSLAIGAATHIVWDGFTHGTSAFVREWPELRALLGEIGVVGGVPLWSYRVLQHGSTLVGGAVVAVEVARALARAPVAALPPATPAERRLRGRARACLAVLPLAVGLGVAFAFAPLGPDPSAIAWFGAHVAVAGLSTTVLLLGMLGIALARSATPDSSPAPDALRTGPW